MVQHRETHHGREVIIGQPGLGAIAADDARPLAVAAVQALDHRDPPAGLVKTFGFDETIQPMTTTPSAA